jgi:NAD(P)-dependent dehydrogenase (short-subunit alcohol dehydrogenase family)|tara:strand:+ start:5949 stop:6860 length:912 start_codon:yes stop_codon:yes gene_type:complete
MSFPGIVNVKFIFLGLILLVFGTDDKIRAQVSGEPRPGQEVVLVTGSTGGLGREVAKRLGLQGAHVIVHGRNLERGIELVDEINEESSGSARFYRADFSSMEQIRELGRQILRDYNRLDVLVNNAGFGSAPNQRMVSQDGHELRFQVNYLAGFLLTKMLMPLILNSQPSRIVNVSSAAQTAIDFDDVMIEKNFSGSRAYAQSKLAQILFTLDLAEELRGTEVIPVSLHPATYMDTEMVRRAGVQPRTSVNEGAEAVMQLVRSGDILPGQYFRGMEVGRSHDQAHDPEARDLLRILSEGLTGVR